MKKTDLIKALAKEAHITQGLAKGVINSLTEIIQKQITEGDHRFAWSGIGIFQAISRSPRTGRDPRTGKPMFIPPKLAVKYKVAPEIDRRLNG